MEVVSEKGSGGLTEQWEQVRRGWYFGSEAFRDELIERLDGVLERRKRTSYHGDAVRKHDEAEAERLLSSGLDCMGLAEKKLDVLPKGNAKKAVLAWLLRKHTTVSRSWIAERLCMGDASRVTKLVSDVAHNNLYAELKSRLVKIPGFTD